MPANKDNIGIRKTIEATVNSFLSAYEDGRKQNNTSIINRDVTPECTRQLLPASLCKALGVPEPGLISNDQYEKLYADDLAVGGVYNTVSKRLVIDAEAKKAAVTSKSDFKYKDGDVVTMEFAWTFYLNEDGSKIDKVIEFADGDAVKRLAAKAQKHQASRGTIGANGDGGKLQQEVDFFETG
ncbi:hypothetical protein FLAG1_04664 [Fusarium langsethiae]|uniref:Uncharacterized protein n=1 Tax=Fusarium langsethiae TaxID=179993 RepID=A0A0N0DFB9_FUSLA|nr:hypothetical protein FLAG1_04664 [Fusarium langsethiae]GKU06538.1 unnamed protein product [Fusarium langsethiae]